MFVSFRCFPRPRIAILASTSRQPLAIPSGKRSVDQVAGTLPARLSYEESCSLLSKVSIMECSMSGQDMVTGAVAKCPFLAAVAHRHGDGFARGLACKPFVSADQAGCRRPIFEESITDFQSTLNLFHGPSGFLPLRRLFTAESGATSGSLSKPESPDSSVRVESSRTACTYSPLMTTAPLATISLPFFSFLVSTVTSCLQPRCKASVSLYVSGLLPNSMGTCLRPLVCCSDGLIVVVVICR